MDSQATKATTGPQLLVNTPTTVRDFLPRAAAALLLPGVTSDREGLAINVNHRWSSASGQLGVQLNEPQVLESMLASLPESRRDIVRERLESRLDDGDDVSVQVALNAESRTVGRAFLPNRDEIESLVSVALPSLERELGAVADSLGLPLVEAEIRGELRGTPPCTGRPRMEIPLRCFSPEAAERLRELVVRYAEQVTGRTASNQRRLQDMGIDAIATLLGNQPQLNLSITYRHRGELVGPAQLTGALRYEHGFTNLNWLRKQCPGDRVAGACLREVMARPTSEAMIARSRRLFVQADVSYLGDYGLDLPADSLSLSLSRSWELKGMAGYGQYFGGLEEGPRRPRLDGNVTFAFQERASRRNDRVVGSITYTLPLTDQLAGAVGAAWANKPEYVGDVDRKLFATLGVSYKLVAGDEDQSP